MINKINIGVDVRILSHSHLTGIGRYAFEILKRIVVNKKFNFILFSDKINSYCQELSKIDNVKIVQYEINRRLFSQIWSQTVLVYEIIKNKIDVFWSPTHRLPLILPKKIKTVLTIHDLICYKAPETMIKSSMILDKYLMPLSIKKSDHVISVSENTARDLVSKLKVRNDKISVIHLAGFLKKNYFSKKSNYLLFVGTIEPRKNISLFLKAFSYSNIKNLKLIIVGKKGWGNIDLDKLVRKYRVNNKVFYKNYVSDKELSKLYSKCYAVVLPSLYEGFGLPIVEALSFSKPLLTSSISSMPEIARKSALYIDPKNLYSIINKLKMINSKKIYEKLQQNAYIENKKYSWKKSADMTLEVLKKVL